MTSRWDRAILASPARTAVAALAAALMVLGLAPATAADDAAPGTISVGGSGEPRLWTSLPKVEQSDLAALAQNHGISIPAAIQRFAWQDSFAVAATAVEEAFPQAFSAAEITSESPAVATIRFVGAVPVEAVAMVNGLPPEVRVDLVPGASATSGQIDEAVIAAHRAVVRSGRVGDVASSYDHATQAVRVAAQPKSTPANVTLATEARSIIAALPATSGRVILELDERIDSRDEARMGGGRLESSGASSLACTAGFNVANSAGTTGVATAGHCPNSLTHENTNGATEYALSFKAGHQGAWGDFQWHTSSETEPDDFYYNSTTTRDVSLLANPVDGQTICRFGHTTKAQCSTVEDLSTCVTVSEVETCRLVRMNNDEAEGGDSGGPWYYGNTAYGFHKGQTVCGFLWASTCDLWSRVTYIDDALGVTVKTS